MLYLNFQYLKYQFSRFHILHLFLYIVPLLYLTYLLKKLENILIYVIGVDFSFESKHNEPSLRARRPKITPGLAYSLAIDAPIPEL